MPTLPVTLPGAVVVACEVELRVSEYTLLLSVLDALYRVQFVTLSNGLRLNVWASTVRFVVVIGRD